MSRGGSCGAWFRRDRAFKTSNGRARRVLDAPGHGAPSCASSDGLEGLYAYPHVTTWLDETLPTIVPISRSELRPIEQWMSYRKALASVAPSRGCDAGTCRRRGARSGRWWWERPGPPWPRKLGRGRDGPRAAGPAPWAASGTNASRPITSSVVTRRPNVSVIGSLSSRIQGNKKPWM